MQVWHPVERQVICLQFHASGSDDLVLTRSDDGQQLQQGSFAVLQRPGSVMPELRELVFEQHLAGAASDLASDSSKGKTRTSWKLLEPGRQPRIDHHALQ